MLRLENVWKVFDEGTINEKAALKGIDLHIKKGEFVTVIGGNGAGNQRCLMRLPEPGLFQKGEYSLTMMM